LGRQAPCVRSDASVSIFEIPFVGMGMEQSVSSDLFRYLAACLHAIMCWAEE
jgi:hypothetical protein